MIIDILGIIELAIAIGIAVVMITIFRSYQKSGIKSLMFNITFAYITFGVSTTNRFFINMAIQNAAIDNALFDLLNSINYGVIFCALCFAMRAVHYAKLLSIGFGDITFAKEKRSDK